MSDTNPLPAQTLLKLADRAIGGGCNNCCVWIPAVECVGERGNPCHVWNGHHCGTVDLDPHAEAYRAARSASPVTLEEALMVKEYEEQERFNNLPPDDRYHKYEPAANATQARYEHARRLAGEGGAK